MLDERLKRWLVDEASRRVCSMGQVMRDLMLDEIERRERVEKAA
jgi:hypothetical protein